MQCERNARAPIAAACNRTNPLQQAQPLTAFTAKAYGLYGQVHPAQLASKSKYCYCAVMSTPLPQVSDPALDLHQVATVLGCSRYGVYRMIRDGALPAFKIRRNLRVRASELKAYLEKQRYQPRPHTYSKI